MTPSQLFLFFSSWNQQPGLASNQWLVAGEMEACYTVVFVVLSFTFTLPERWFSLWEFMWRKPPSPLLSLVQCLIIKKHLWWPLSASCHILEGESDIFPVIDGELHLNSGQVHVTEGNINKKNNNLHSWVHSMLLHRLWLSFIQPVLSSKNV